jgi:hypothetical protein
VSVFMSVKFDPNLESSLVLKFSANIIGLLKLLIGYSLTDIQMDCGSMVLQLLFVLYENVKLSNETPTDEFNQEEFKSLVNNATELLISMYTRVDSAAIRNALTSFKDFDDLLLLSLANSN